MGARHARAFAQVLGAEQVAMACRDDRDRARLAALNLPTGVQAVAFGPGLAAQFDLAVVAVQTERHFGVAQALDMPLLVEKPLCQSPDQAQALLERPHRTFVGHSSRMEAGAGPFHEVVRQGRVGQLRGLTMSVVEPHLRRGDAPLPMVASRLYDVVVHAVARIVELLPAEPPMSAAASLAEQWATDPGLHAEVAWLDQPLLKLDLQSVGPGSCVVQASGDGGRVRWESKPGVTEVGYWPTERGAFQPVAVGGPEPQLALAHEVVAALQTGAPSVLDATHGLRVMQIAGAMVAAAVRGAGLQWDWGWVR